MVADLLGERAEEVAAEIGGTAVQADVTVAADVARMVEAAGRIDVLVNNAGGGFADDVLEISEEEWDGDVTVNLKSAFLCSKAVLSCLFIQTIFHLVGDDGSDTEYRTKRKWAIYRIISGVVVIAIAVLGLKLSPVALNVYFGIYMCSSNSLLNFLRDHPHHRVFRLW